MTLYQPFLNELCFLKSSSQYANGYSLSSQTISHPPEVREGLADVTCMHKMLTNQILPFHLETVETLWLQYVRLILVQFYLRLCIKQAMN